MQNSKGHISAKHAPNSLPKTSLKSLFIRLSFCVEIILVSGFFVAQADSIYCSFSSGIWARHEPEAKHSGQRLIPKPRGFLSSCGWKIYSSCNSNNTTEDNNTTEENMCKFLYSTEEFALLRVIAAVTAFCVPPCYLFPRTLVTSAVCYPILSLRFNSVLRVPSEKLA